MIDCERCWTNLWKMKDAIQDSNKHPPKWSIFTSSTLEASVLMNCSKHTLHQNYIEHLTMKQMFYIFEKLVVGQSDENDGVNTINWVDSSWTHLYLVGDEEVITLSHAKVYVFSDSVLCLGKLNENPLSNAVWEDKLTRFKSSPQYRALETNDGEPKAFEWSIFTGFTTLQLCNKVQEFLSKMREDREEFTGRIIFMSMFNDIIWGSRDNKVECESILNSFLSMQRDFQQHNGHSSDLDQKQSGILFELWQTTRRMGQSRRIDDDKIWRKRTPSFPSYESITQRSA